MNSANQSSESSSNSNSFEEFSCQCDAVNIKSGIAIGFDSGVNVLSPIASIQASSISLQQVAVWATVYAPVGTVVEAFRANGSWAGIGVVEANNKLYNPAVPVSYLADAEHIRMRLNGIGNSEVTAPVVPVITHLSSSMNKNNTVHLKGATTLKTGIVEALSNGVWKGVAYIVNGEFSNPAIPKSYLLNPETLRIRVKGNVATSEYIDSTLGYPHARSLLFSAMMSSSDEQKMMHWRIRKADYQPTGYFAPANTNIEVWVTGNAENVTLLVGIQGMADRDNINKQSPNARPTRLVRGKNIIRDPFGGVIHVRNLVGIKKSATRIILGSEALPIPYYVSGFTSTLEWKQMLAASRLPEVQLTKQRSVIAAFRTTALLFPDVDPAAIVDSHEKVLSLEADISGLDGSSPLNSRSSLLLYAVESSASMNPHATTGLIGIPASCNTNYAEALVGGRAANRWVTLHEYGHHYQNVTNGWHLVGELSTSLYALAVNRVTPNEYTHQFPTRWPATQAWLAQPRSKKNINQCPDQSAFYEQLRKGLGEDFLRNWDRYIRVNPCQQGVKCFVLTATKVAGYDLGEFFADWALLKDTDTDTWKELKALKLPQPQVNLTRIVPYI